MNQKVNINLPNGIELYIKREDLLHPYISGNKFRKLKYNVLEALRLEKEQLLTFGGAFSNHILALAAAGKENNLPTIGVIRGEELENKVEDNPTLLKAMEFGMQFKFVSRAQYRLKEEGSFLVDLQKEFGDFYLVPEGGTNSLAIKGCEEILDSEDKIFDFVCCAVGTGGTISGIINSAANHQKVLGFSSLKGGFLSDVICNFVTRKNWEIFSEYHFGGYGKTTDELIGFLNSFYENTGIPLDPIYTGKMMYGILDMVNRGLIPSNSKIVAIHTGGLQGIKGMNQVLKNKNKIQLKYES
ncbi:1-aminocyclopropane-1-carboxylate deaminase/D-cysteine desulfhydrase [Flavobacterium chuncheonense]|uniref:1-aminocyclopropane-1-carboxylate deaminase/D-cysteine desulfhydrase n=1 Tax=Flavobacterium chuncheonense TaxID=2026653 RepID=A0ABW5YKW1_9FLAO